MAQGFATIQRNTTNETTGYTTLFEKITELTGGQKQSFNWYKNAVRKSAMDYKKDPSKIIRDERIDNRGKEEETDENILRAYAVSGHLYMFEYKAKTKWLPYYDTFPLVYVMKASPDEFWGVNLHYMAPKKRIMVIKKLMEGRIDVPKRCFHKYLTSQVDGMMLDLAAAEWDTAILLPIENFVRNVKGSAGRFPYTKELVWEETDDNYYDRIRGRRIIRGYGNRKDTEMVK
tara:strand:+ start:344 stop:1036 length:693 start_codon:yes stop_codon:yes gene_type:complete